MGENLADFLFDVAMILVFVSALSLFLFLNPLSEKNVELLAGTINRDKEVAENRVYNSEYTTVTGADIISDIINGLEADIIVDSKYISKDVDIFKDDFSFSSINERGNYKVKRNIDSNGIVESVKYESE
ncbi:hypothetical protein [Acetivibrio cellulolyticus]|uniref:hypothetical protein n=1 Tax=Acetivibrio cellulolyticus TaxID=35830 RepID=UPI0001E2F0EE|nr:hypothetical protein [Acetivibrio cellulolyticus]